MTNDEKAKILNNFTNYELFDFIIGRANKLQLEYVLLRLLVEKKIAFISLQNMYVKFLEMKDKDLNLLLDEANTCIAQQLIHQKIKSSKQTKELNNQRAIYFLHQLNRSNIEYIKELFNYNSDIAEKVSRYGRMKNSYRLEALKTYIEVFGK